MTDMAETEMVQRVGERLRQECLAVFGSTWSNDVAWRFAQAAIEEMKDATFDMLLAGQEIVNLSDTPGTYEFLSREEIGDIYDAMLDAALKDNADG